MRRTSRPGVPSALLERRPDIRQTEQQLVAANAQIGVAKSAYFPQIPLTASGGFESTALRRSSPAQARSGPPLPRAHRAGVHRRTDRSQVAVAQARREEAVISYQHAIRQAFREVSDALVGYRKLREFREQQALLFGSAQDARRLSRDPLRRRSCQLSRSARRRHTDVRRRARVGPGRARGARRRSSRSTGRSAAAGSA